LSTIFGSISLSIDGKANSALIDFTEESECEIESIDILLLMIQAISQDCLERSKSDDTIAFSDNLIFVNFPEIPIPPPKV
jgi:hypothetical protein